LYLWVTLQKVFNQPPLVVGVFWFPVLPRNIFVGKPLLRFFCGKRTKHETGAQGKKTSGFSIKIRSFSKILELCFQNLPFHVALVSFL